MTAALLNKKELRLENLQVEPYFSLNGLCIPYRLTS